MFLKAFCNFYFAYRFIHPFIHSFSCLDMMGAGVTFDLTFFDNSKVIDFDD